MTVHHVMPAVGTGKAVPGSQTHLPHIRYCRSHKNIPLCNPEIRYLLMFLHLLSQCFLKGLMDSLSLFSSWFFPFLNWFVITRRTGGLLTNRAVCLHFHGSYQCEFLVERWSVHLQTCQLRLNGSAEIFASHCAYNHVRYLKIFALVLSI